MYMVEPNTARVIEDMSFEDYAALPHVNQSFIKTLLSKSPLHAISNKSEPTVAMRTGTLAHQIAFEEIDPESDLSVWPKRRAGREYDSFCAQAEAEGRQVVTNAEFEKCVAMRHAMPLSMRKLFQASESEVTILFEFFDIDSRERIPAKARIDALSSLIIDYKTTSQGLSKREFQNSIGKYYYDLQAAWYQQAVYAASGKWKAFHWVAQETSPPYDVNVFKASDQCLASGTDWLNQGLELYAQCIQTAIYPGYFDGIAEIDAPEWHLFEPELEIDEAKGVATL